MSPELGPAEYLCYRVIREREQHDMQLPKTDFAKFCSLANLELYQEDIGDEVGFPMYWYMYGYYPYEQELDLSFIDEQPYSYGTRPGYQITIESGFTEDIFSISSTLKSEIDQVVSSIVGQFKGKYGTHHAINELYEHEAPSPFVQEMNSFRNSLEDLDEIDPATPAEYVSGVNVDVRELFDVDIEPDRPNIDDDTVERLNRHLDGLIETYPTEEYELMHKPFRRWQSICRQLLTNGQLSQLDTFQEKFWETFSKVELRIKHHYNIPITTVIEWKGGRDEELENLESTLNQFRKVALNYKEPSDYLDRYSQPYDKAIDEKLEEIG